MDQDAKIMQRLHRVAMARNDSLKTDEERAAADRRLQQRMGKK